MNKKGKQLFDLCLAGDVAGLRKLLKSGIDPDIRNDAG
jgi:hypothetical protein